MEFDLSEIDVMLGIPCGSGYMPWQAIKSLSDTIIDLKNRGIDFDLAIVAGCSIVTHARVKVVAEFLNSSRNRLLMIDDDIVWRPQDVIRLLALSTRRQIVGATYPAKRDAVTFMLKWEGEEVEADEYGCLPIRGMGLGFTMVTREVVERLAEKSEKLIFPWYDKPLPDIFRCDASSELGRVIDGVEYRAARGEDMAFFDDARELGYSVYLDPMIDLGHVGTKEYTGSIRNAMKRKE